ncbi:MAG: hypothetical protein R6U37_01610 [Dehalococcoidia bacterium]
MPARKGKRGKKRTLRFKRKEYNFDAGKQLTTNLVTPIDEGWKTPEDTAKRLDFLIPAFRGLESLKSWKRWYMLVSPITKREATVKFFRDHNILYFCRIVALTDEPVDEMPGNKGFSVQTLVDYFLIPAATVDKRLLRRRGEVQTFPSKGLKSWLLTLFSVSRHPDEAGVHRWQPSRLLRLALELSLAKHILDTTTATEGDKSYESRTYESNVAQAFVNDRTLFEKMARREPADTLKERLDTLKQIMLEVGASEPVADEIIFEINRRFQNSFEFEGRGNLTVDKQAEADRGIGRRVEELDISDAVTKHKQVIILSSETETSLANKGFEPD